MPKKEAPRKSSVRPPNSPRSPYSPRWGSINTSPTSDGQTTFPLGDRVLDRGSLARGDEVVSSFGFSQSAQPYERDRIAYRNVDYEEFTLDHQSDIDQGVRHWGPRPRGPGRNVERANRLWTPRAEVALAREGMNWWYVVCIIALVLLYTLIFESNYQGIHIKKDELKRFLMDMQSLLDSHQIKLTRKSILHLTSELEINQRQKNWLIDLLEYPYTEIVELIDKEGILEDVVSIDPYDVVEYIQLNSTTTTFGTERNLHTYEGVSKKRKSKRKYL